MSNKRTDVDKAKIFASAFIGMVVGIVAAGAVAWYVIEKKSTSFVHKSREHKTSSPAAPLAINVPAEPAPASGVTETGQRFEFYKVLTDKSDSSSEQVGTFGRAPRTAESKAKYFVQAGSFQDMGDAEKLKAKLAFSGFEANIQTANIPEKGVWYRVRLGPYGNGEASKIVVSLRQNGIIATQIQTR